jgi:hypothetical protein
MSKHRVKTHHWFNGVLHTLDHWFETLEEAMEHVSVSDKHVVKVYNEAGELHHIKTPQASETYA